MSINYIPKQSEPVSISYPGFFISKKNKCIVCAFDETNGIVIDSGASNNTVHSFSGHWIPFHEKTSWTYLGPAKVTIEHETQ